MIKMEEINDKKEVILALHEDSILQSCKGLCELEGYNVYVYEGDTSEGILELYEYIKPGFLFMDLNFKKYISTVEPAQIVYDGLKKDIENGLVCYLGISGGTIIGKARDEGIPVMNNVQFIGSLRKILKEKSLQKILDDSKINSDDIRISSL